MKLSPNKCAITIKIIYYLMLLYSYIYAMTGLGIHAISVHISVATQTFLPSDTQLQREICSLGSVGLVVVLKAFLHEPLNFLCALLFASFSFCCALLMNDSPLRAVPPSLCLPLSMALWLCRTSMISPAILWHI